MKKFLTFFVGASLVLFVVLTTRAQKYDSGGRLRTVAESALTASPTPTWTGSVQPTATLTPTFTPTTHTKADQGASAGNELDPWFVQGYYANPSATQTKIPAIIHLAPGVAASQTPFMGQGVPARPIAFFDRQSNVWRVWQSQTSGAGSSIPPVALYDVNGNPILNPSTSGGGWHTKLNDSNGNPTTFIAGKLLVRGQSRSIVPMENPTPFYVNFLPTVSPTPFVLPVQSPGMVYKVEAITQNTGGAAMSITVGSPLKAASPLVWDIGDKYHVSLLFMQGPITFQVGTGLSAVGWTGNIAIVPIAY